MRLHRTLFYLLLLIFVVSILMVVFIDSSCVMSGVATGLITGSFVALVSTVVNYVYAWQQFMNKYFENAMQLYHELENDLIQSEVKIEYFNKNDKQFLIDNAPQHTMEELEKEFQKDRRYEKYRVMFDYAPYASLFFRKRTLAVLDKIDRYVFGLGMIPSFGRTSTLLVGLQEGHFSSKEEEEIAIGDRDSFFDYIVQSATDWRDYTAHCMRQLVSLLSELQKSLRPLDVSEDYRELPKILSIMAESHLKGLPGRNPVKEHVDDFEKEMASRLANKEQ